MKILNVKPTGKAVHAALLSLMAAVAVFAIGCTTTETVVHTVVVKEQVPGETVVQTVVVEKEVVVEVESRPHAHEHARTTGTASTIGPPPLRFA